MDHQAPLRACQRRVHQLAREDARRLGRPHAARLLVTTFGESSITRLDDVTLRLHRDTGFFEGKMHTLARGRSQPFRDGDSVALPDMKATVTETTSDGRPRTIEFRFNSTLESPHWLWMRGSGMSLVDLTPPQLGETVVIGVAS